MFLFETAPDGSLVLSGVQDAGVALTVPDSRDGKAVRRVARGAFRELSGVRTLDFAPGIAEIGDFACYGMPDLISVSLSETLTEVGDAVFRACDALQSVHYAAPQGNFYALRALLSEPEPAFRCELKLSDGEAELYFPSFQNEFDEDTMARAIHPRIEGCGYAFRECVTRREIDFSSMTASLNGPRRRSGKLPAALQSGASVPPIGSPKCGAKRTGTISRPRARPRQSSPSGTGRQVMTGRAS